MSQGFADKTTEQIWKGITKMLINIYLQRQALKRLGYLNIAKKSRMLRSTLQQVSPPGGNRTLRHKR
jgi:plasmid maintenance system killer protein